MFNSVIKNNLHRYRHGHCDREAGFTLIEFLIYSVIVTLMISVLILAGTNIMQARARIGVVEEVNYNAKLIMNSIKSHIRQAESFTIDGGKLSLVMPISENSPAVFEEIGVMTIKRGTNDPVPISSDTVIVSVVFTDLTYPDTQGTVRVELTVEHSNPAGRSEYDFERTFYTTENLRKEKGDFAESVPQP